MKKCFIFFIMLFISTNLICQIVLEENQFVDWLKVTTKQDSLRAGIRVYALSSKFDYPFNDKKLCLKNGIYQFEEIKSHNTPFLLVVNDNNYTFIEDYSVNFLISLYWNLEKKINSNQKKLAFSKKFIQFLQNRATND